LETIAVAGALAAKPGNGGEAWVRLSWVLGLRRLGFDAWLLEECDAETAAAGRSFFERTVERFGLGDRAVLIADGEPSGPLDPGGLADLAAESALVNISGNLRDADLLPRFRRRAYVDLDPGFTQIWATEGALGDQLGAHDRHFTVGLNLSGADCEVPDAGYEWVPLPPPVLLDEWAPPSPRRFDRFTSVATWRNPLGTIEHGGRAYTLKHHQLRRFAGLPAQTGLPFEIALDVHPDEADEAARLRELDWTVVDPVAVASDPDSFRDYVRGSGAEFAVAQGIYAEAATGWLSDRTAHYLAVGRPALVQETGLPSRFRPDAGLVTFTEPEEAQALAEELLSAYELHSTAARAYAERTFDSDLVLTRMLEALE
jgi:hypothetical protein